jgi:hypothetical protein
MIGDGPGLSTSIIKQLEALSEGDEVTFETTQGPIEAAVDLVLRSRFIQQDGSIVNNGRLCVYPIMTTETLSRLQDGFDQSIGGLEFQVLTPRAHGIAADENTWPQITFFTEYGTSALCGELTGVEVDS